MKDNIVSFCRPEVYSNLTSPTNVILTGDAEYSNLERLVVDVLNCHFRWNSASLEIALAGLEMRCEKTWHRVHDFIITTDWLARIMPLIGRLEEITYTVDLDSAQGPKSTYPILAVTLRVGEHISIVVTNGTVDDGFDQSNRLLDLEDKFLVDIDNLVTQLDVTNPKFNHLNPKLIPHLHALLHYGATANVVLSKDANHIDIDNTDVTVVFQEPVELMHYTVFTNIGICIKK